MLFDKKIKKLGFGLMRLPKLGEGFDIEQIKAMVDRFLEAGFTYFDTAWIYSGSEEAIRKALVERYPRESYQLATKLAAWAKCETKEDAVAQFETSLERTGAGYFDMYLLHNLGENRTHFFNDYELWDFVREKKAEGKIKHYGFSFHSTPEELEEILTAHPDAEFVQLQINYADWENSAVQSRGIYEVARKHNVPIIVMEPVKGGLLADPPETVAQILKSAEPDSSLSSWAVRYAADLEGVEVVLSGMSTLQQMEDNISYMKDFDHLSEAQRKTLAEAREAFEKIPLIPCTTCNYCAKVCPMEIGISGTFTAVNMYTLYRDLEKAKSEEGWKVKNHGKKQAVECVKCGACEEACPQHIAIRDELEKAAELFGQTAG